MSKSDPNTNSFISLLDTPDVIIRKFKRAVTDSDAKVFAGEEKPGVTNLMGIYSALTGKPFEEIEKEFDGKGYGDFKQAVAETVVDVLAPIRENYTKILADNAYMQDVLSKGRERSTLLAGRTLQKVYKKVGFLQI